MEEIDNFNFPIVRKHYMYELWGQVGRDLRGMRRVVSGLAALNMQHST